LIQRRAKIGENREKQTIYNTKEEAVSKVLLLERPGVVGFGVWV